jgi:GDP-mannose 4,6-dehydratase
MSIITNIDTCRLCQSSDIENVISLGEQIITSRFPIYGDYSTPKTPIDLCVCHECGLLQLLQTTFSSELYEYEYGYRSGINNTMRAHLKQYQEEILDTVKSMKHGDTIVDIGSNDSTMLQYYSNEYKRIGVDPTGKQFYQYYGDVELIPNYFNVANFRERYPDIHPKIVSSISMFYDLPDPVQFAKDICEILDDDGIWTCEQSYVLSMLRTNSIDTICHEHLEYYALRQIKKIADMANFKIINIVFNDCNGGSFRIYFAKKGSPLYQECSELIASILQNEIEYGLLDTKHIYTKFIEDCDKEVRKLLDLLHTINKNGKRAYIYGASTKGNCLLQYANIGEDFIKYAVERNPNKVGKMTNTGIEIISEETMRENPPDYLLVLPWHFRDEIIVREDAFLEGGGQFIFPFPHFEIVSKKKRVLITGCDGFIAHYVKETFVKDYLLYGITKQIVNKESNITKFDLDMCDVVSLENTISIIQPDTIIHLAGISSSQQALDNPIETIRVNGLITCNLCDIIYRNGWKIKLFNASSSEIYKGHNKYTVAENDTHMHHLHPYSIAKTMAHNTVDFYRKTHSLPFSNGVIFTTESKRKSSVFLLSKLANHISEWKQTKMPITVGSLESYRNILHASDVASAISVIMSQDIGDSYLICNNESFKILDIVIQLYETAGIYLYQREDGLYENITDVLVVKIDNKLGCDTTPINICGVRTKLDKIGWKPKYEMIDILKDLISIPIHI